MQIIWISRICSPEVPDLGWLARRACIFTHPHKHLARADQTFRRDLCGYGLLDEQAYKELNLQIHPVELLEAIAIGEYRITALPANHARGFGAYLYAIERDGCRIFYGTDTAEFLDDTWQAFDDLKLAFDLVVLDHTYGPDEPGSDHLSAHQVAEHTQRMRAEGILKADGRVFATHIAHEGNPDHDTLCRICQSAWIRDRL